ncbi:MAG: gas vesicle protein K [Chloroflexi bacterium]|nr:gas vesicle protein K [Chloroflexota bacterium]
MPLRIDEDGLKQGVLGLVLALVEIIRDALKHQALRRVEGGSLSPQEMERLGRALEDLDAAIEEIQQELGLNEAVRSLREGLDELVDDALERIINPERWQGAAEARN